MFSKILKSLSLSETKEISSQVTWKWSFLDPEHNSKASLKKSKTLYFDIQINNLILNNEW